MIGYRSDRVSGTILHVIDYSESEYQEMINEAHCFDSNDGKASFIFFLAEDCDKFIDRWSVDLTPNKRDLDVILKLTK